MSLTAFKIKGIQQNLLKNTNKVSIASNGINFGGTFFLPTKGKRVVIKPLKYGEKQFFVSISRTKIVVRVDENCIVRYYPQFLETDDLIDITKLKAVDMVQNEALDEIYFRSRGTMFVEFKNLQGYLNFKERF